MKNILAVKNCHKKSYDLEVDAVVVAATRLRNNNDTAQLRHYKCPTCVKYHLTKMGKMVKE